MRMSNMARQGIILVAFICAVAMSYGPLQTLFHSKMYRDYHSLIPFIPIVSIYLLFKKRNEILQSDEYSIAFGSIFVCCGILLYALGSTVWTMLDNTHHATVAALSAVLVLWGSFMMAYGTKTFRRVLFPMLFLIFAIPLPVRVMEGITTILQTGSTEFTNMLLWISGVPFLREGFVFQLTGMAVEVAKECSGVRSGIALFITALLAGHLFLATKWKKGFLAVCVIPVTMFKNGLRITTLTLLGTYVDPRILQSSLHREGGIPFFLVGLLIMAPILIYLRRTEKSVKKIPSIDNSNE